MGETEEYLKIEARRVELQQLLYGKVVYICIHTERGRERESESETARDRDI